MWSFESQSAQANKMNEKPTRRRWSFKFIDLFLEKGPIHGLPYIGKKLLTVVERLLWGILTLVALLISIYLALESVNKFKTKSTVISVEKDYHYWNTTLPSLTICPMNRISYAKFTDYCKEHGIPPRDQYGLYMFLNSLANSTYFNFQNIIDPPKIKNFSINPMDYMHIIYNLTDNLLEAPTKIINATRDGNLLPTQQVLTEWGICYTTNNYLIDDLSTANLLFASRPKEAFSIENHIVVGNVFDSEISYSFTNFIGPIALFIHDPNEVMEFQKHKLATAVPFEFSVKMLEIVASDEFGKENTIEQRKCRFPSESNLKHFPIYTTNLCEQQCRINIAYKLCKCIPHFYPNLYAKTPVCHYRVLKECISKYRAGFENLNLMKQVSNQSIECECLHNCRIVQLLEAIWQPLGKSESLIGNGGCVISRVFPRIRYCRQTIFRLTDLLVSIGGNAGFFLGFSVLGAVEIIYYFTFRLFWHCLGYRE